MDQRFLSGENLYITLSPEITSLPYPLVQKYKLIIGIRQASTVYQRSASLILPALSLSLVLKHNLYSSLS